MAIHISEVVQSNMRPIGASFAAARLDLAALGEFVNPVVGLDHFRMRGPTFQPHPHAGFSAISYMFEDSVGAMRNRDSVGHDFVAGPGDVIWTQAGSGVVHDEFPAVTGHEVHGIQLFVNLQSAHKTLPPVVFWVRKEDIPVVGDTDGNRIRVVVGEYEGRYSPLVPAEPFLLLDGVWRKADVLRVPGDWNIILYLLTGELDLSVDGKRVHIAGGQALGLRSDDAASIELDPDSPSHMLVLAGPAVREPMVSHGPFIMNSSEQISDAVRRFNAGEMGRL